MAIQCLENCGKLRHVLLFGAIPYINQYDTPHKSDQSFLSDAYYLIAHLNCDNIHPKLFAKLGNCVDSETVHPFQQSDSVKAMSNNMDLYYFPASPASRTVMLFAHALGLVCNMKMVNVIEGEQMKPEFLKLNPMHTVPTIDDNGYVLWESQAIVRYLADKFDKEGKFKTHNPQAEGIVNQLLYFDASTLFPRLMAYIRPVAMANQPPNNEKLSKVEEALNALNTLLAKDKYTGVPNLTLADFALATTISTAEAVQIDIGRYPNIKSWLERMKKEMPGYNELNQKGSDMIASGFKAHAG